MLLVNERTVRIEKQKRDLKLESIKLFFDFINKCNKQQKTKLSTPC